jgi:cold shock CspA family protein
MHISKTGTKSNREHHDEEDLMQIHWRHPKKLSEIDREYALRRLQELEEGRGDLTDLWIDIASGSGHHRKGDEKVTIRCQARQATIVASGHDAEPGLALRVAIEKFEREVRHLRERRSHHRVRAKSGSPPHLGIVDRVVPEENYGFLLTDSGEQVYFHRNALTGGLRLEDLEEGQRVALNYHGGSDGLQANVVTPPSPDSAGGP